MSTFRFPTKNARLVEIQIRVNACEMSINIPIPKNSLLSGRENAIRRAVIRHLMLLYKDRQCLQDVNSNVNAHGGATSNLNSVRLSVAGMCELQRGDTTAAQLYKVTDVS